MPHKRDRGWGPTGPVALSLAGQSDRCSPASTSSSKRRDSHSKVTANCKQSNVHRHRLNLYSPEQVLVSISLK